VRTDAYALRSQQEAKRAFDAGYLAEENCSVEVQTRKGRDCRRPTMITFDQEQLSKASPNSNRLFAKDGFVTAGNASGIVDGAAALVIAGRRNL